MNSDAKSSYPKSNFSLYKTTHPARNIDERLGIKSSLQQYQDNSPKVHYWFLGNSLFYRKIVERRQLIFIKSSIFFHSLFKDGTPTTKSLCYLAKSKKSCLFVYFLTYKMLLSTQNTFSELCHL